MLKVVAEGRDDEGRRWTARSRASLLVSAAVFAIPIGLSVLVSLVASHVLPHPHTVAGRVGWWIVLLGAAGVTAVVGERLSRSLLPLAALLNMSMLFPDRAPS